MLCASVGKAAICAHADARRKRDNESLVRFGRQYSNLGIQRSHPEGAETFLWTSVAKEAVVGVQNQTD
jgi:hypothetical protein